MPVNYVTNNHPARNVSYRHRRKHVELMLRAGMKYDNPLPLSPFKEWTQETVGCP